MNVDSPDEKSVMTYVACLCDALHRAVSSDSAAVVHRQEVLYYLTVFKDFSHYFVLLLCVAD